MKRRAFLFSAAASALAAEPVADAAAVRAAARAAKPGDTIAMRAGEWRDADIVFEADGTPERPITLRGPALLTGRSRIRLAGKHLVLEGVDIRGAVETGAAAIEVRADHSRVTQCAVRGLVKGESTRGTHWISLYGRGNRFDHCFVEGKTTLGTTVVVWLDKNNPAPPRHTIEWNHFAARPPLGENGGEILRVGDSSTSMQECQSTVQNNYFSACNGEVEIISNKSCGNLYRANTFENCEGTLTLRHGNRCTVEGNWFLGHERPLTGGVRIIGEDHKVTGNYFSGLRGAGTRAALCMMDGIENSPLNGYFQVQRALVERNTFIDCAETFVIGYRGKNATLAPRACRIVQNLVVGGRDPIIRTVDAEAEIAWVDNRLDAKDAPETSASRPSAKTTGPDWLR